MAAKAKQAKEAKKETPAEVAQKLADMLNQGAKEQRGDANVEEGVPMKKIAGGRSTWKGIMTLPNGSGGDLAKLAVKTCTAVDEEKFERHMYHSADCKHSLKYGKMTCEGCGAEVAKDAAVKGVESNGEIVLISDEELAKLVPQNEKTMKVLEYCEAAEIDPVYFEGTEYLSPDKGGEATFAVMREFMKRTGKVAKGIRVKRGKEQYFVVRPYGQNGMTINLLRADYEVRDASSLWLPVVANGEAVEMFAALAEAPALTKPFTAAKRDQYLANANKLVEAKRTGKVPDCPTPEPEQSGTDDLLAALKATLAAKAAKAGK